MGKANLARHISDTHTKDAKALKILVTQQRKQKLRERQNQRRKAKKEEQAKKKILRIPTRKNMEVSPVQTPSFSPLHLPQGLSGRSQTLGQQHTESHQTRTQRIVPSGVPLVRPLNFFAPVYTAPRNLDQ